SARMAARWYLGLCCGLLALTPLRACDTPVFRYAREHWAVDPYEAVLFHRGPLSAADRDSIARLEREADRNQPHCTLQQVDVAEPLSDYLQALWQIQTAPELPWLVVRYPAAARLRVPAWAGHLDAGTVESLLESPARQEIARRLHAGDA